MLGLFARELWRKLRRRLRVGPVFRWRYSGRTPDRVLIVPPDLRLADPHKASEIRAGRFLLGGMSVDVGEQSPFRIETRSASWRRSLDGFRWLRHLHEAGTAEAAESARELVGDWIALHGRRVAMPAWEPGTTARRVIAWLQHSSIVLQGADYAFYRNFLRTLAMQIRYLRITAAEMPPGEERLRARIALAFAALSLPNRPAALKAATRNLAIELDRQILPDGGHVSRNPLALIELLADLLPLRQTYANQAETPPAALLNAIERMFPALRFFRHADGSLGRFNGMGATSFERVASVLRHDDSGGTPLLHASHSGYERLSIGGTTVLADTGAPPPQWVSENAHAGCLSFELSSGRQCYIVNSGVDARGADDFRVLARSTAAHSTATLNDSSSCRYGPASALLGAMLLSGPRKVTSRRLDKPGTQGFSARHDGYLQRFGLLHEREMMLAQDGRVLDGSDRFLRPDGRPAEPGAASAVAVRFHLHPDAALFLDRGDRLIVGGQGDEAWVFACDGVEPVVEESIFFAGIAGPRRTRQIVLSFDASTMPEVQWRFTRMTIAGRGQGGAKPAGGQASAGRDPGPAEDDTAAGNF